MTKSEIEHYLAVGILKDKLGLYFEPFVSICKNNIPGAGSHTAPVSAMNELEVFKQLKGITLHKSGGFTLRTDIVNIRFWPSTFKQDYEIALKRGPAIMERLRSI